MKKISLLVAMIALSSFASGSSCWKINNDDQRYFCEATAEGKSSCWKIQNADKRNYCEAIAEGKNSCWKIQNANTREMCKAQTGQ